MNADAMALDELRLAVAQEVFGYQRHKWKPHAALEKTVYCDCGATTSKADPVDGWCLPPVNPPDEPPDYPRDIRAAWLVVEGRIAELGLQEKYAYFIKRIVSGMGDSAFIIRDGRGWYDDMQFKFIHATPEQRCRAAVSAVRAAPRGD